MTRFISGWAKRPSRWLAAALAFIVVAEVASMGTDDSLTDAGLPPPSVARLGLYVAALFCALAAALDQHVRSTRTPAGHRIGR